MNQFRRHRSRRNNPPLAATRERLAFAVLALFAIVCLSAMLAPDAAVLDQTLSFVGGLVAMVMAYYFQRRA